MLVILYFSSTSLSNGVEFSTELESIPFYLLMRILELVHLAFLSLTMKTLMRHLTIVFAARLAMELMKILDALAKSILYATQMKIQ